MTSHRLVLAAAHADRRQRLRRPAAPPRPAGSTRTDLQRHDLSIAGREVLQARVDFAPGRPFPAHKHPGEEIIYVLEGTLEYQVDGKPPVTLKAGECCSFRPGGPRGEEHRQHEAGRNSRPMSWRRESR